MWKNVVRVGQATDDNIIRRMRFACWIKKAIDTQTHTHAHTVFYVRTGPSEPRPHYRGFTIKSRHTTIGRASLCVWSARSRDIYPDSTHNTHNRQTDMLPAVFEPAIPASERKQTDALDRRSLGSAKAPHCYVYMYTACLVYMYTACLVYMYTACLV